MKDARGDVPAYEGLTFLYLPSRKPLPILQKLGSHLSKSSLNALTISYVAFQACEPSATSSTTDGSLTTDRDRTQRCRFKARFFSCPSPSTIGGSVLSRTAM